MKKIKLISFFVVLSYASFSQTESIKNTNSTPKKDFTTINNNSKMQPNNNTNGQKRNDDSQSSNVTKPEPTIIYQDDEKIKVQPN